MKVELKSCLTLLLVFGLTITAYANKRPTINGTTSVEITLINIPDDLENTVLSLIDNFNEWEAGINNAVVANNTAYFSITEIIEVQPLQGYYDSPQGANFAFRFINPNTLTNVIRAYFTTNDGNFRIKLEPNKVNEIVVDLNYREILIIDQDKSLSLNGVIKDESPVAHLDSELFVYPNGASKAVVLSFDDGRVEDRKMVEILDLHGLKATFNLISASLYSDYPIFIHHDEVATLYEKHEIASHSLNQERLENLPSEMINRFVLHSKDSLQKIVNYDIKGFAYPYGTYKNEVITALKAKAYSYARTNIHTWNTSLPFDFEKDLFRWNPTMNLYSYRLPEILENFINANPKTLQLLYMYGHSVDFVDRWDYVDSVFSKLNNDKEIWNPTNIEMARYLRALSSVIVNNKLDFYNVSNETSVWIKSAEGIKELPPLTTINSKSNTQIVHDQCGTVINNPEEVLMCYKVNQAESYRFVISNDNSQESIERSTNSMKLSAIEGFVLGSEYRVKVAVQRNGKWSDYGQECSFRTSELMDVVSFQEGLVNDGITNHPNPYTDTFQISYPSDLEGTVNVSIYDMSGRQVAQSQHEAATLSEQNFGQGLSAGIYNVVLEHGTEVKTLRVVKQ